MPGKYTLQLNFFFRKQDSVKSILAPFILGKTQPYITWKWWLTIYYHCQNRVRKVLNDSNSFLYISYLFFEVLTSKFGRMYDKEILVLGLLRIFLKYKLNILSIFKKMVCTTIYSFQLSDINFQKVTMSKIAIFVNNINIYRNYCDRSYLMQVDIFL